MLCRLRVRLCNFRPLDTGSKINPALNFVCGLRNPCLSSIQKGFVSNFKRFRYLGNFTCVRRSTKLASLQHTKISHLCHVLALSKMIQSEIYSAGLQFITLAQHLWTQTLDVLKQLGDSADYKYAANRPGEKVAFLNIYFLHTGTTLLIKSCTRLIITNNSTSFRKNIHGYHHWDKIKQIWNVRILHTCAR